jgi:hypothetical protein
MALVINPPVVTKIKLDLDGPDGNVFCVIGTALALAKRLHWDKADIDEFRNKCMSRDYGYTLVQVDKAFGEFIDLEMCERTMLSIPGIAFKAHFLNDITRHIENE